VDRLVGGRHAQRGGAAGRGRLGGPAAAPPLPRTHAIGLLVGFAGVLAISWPELQGSRATMLGTSLVVLAVICYGLAVNLAVPLQQRHGALPVLLRAQLAAPVLLLPFGLWGLRGSHFAWGPALAMLPLGILGTGLAYVL
jgi:drug/metabolite transporter (DMT)-like permease